MKRSTLTKRIYLIFVMLAILAYWLTMTVLSDRIDKNIESIEVSTSSTSLGQGDLPALGTGEERIVFVSNRDGNQEIYVMNADGSEQTGLTYNRADDYDPSWSPDGKYIVFVSDRYGDGDLYMMLANGNEQTQLTENTYSDGRPKWSPDGKSMVFESYQAEEGNLIKLLHVESGEIEQVVGKEYLAGYPSWSPDGKEILFASNKDHENVYQNELYIANLTDDSIKRISHIDETNVFINPEWSPDERWVAFNTLPRPSKIAIMDMNTLDIRYAVDDKTDSRHTPTSLLPQEFNPTWSPSGNQIAFSFSLDNSDIYVLTLDSGQLAQLTDNPASDHSPSWWGP